MRAFLPIVVGVSLLAAGCTAAARSEEPETPSPFAACSPSPASSSSGAGALPDISLECFAGGEAVKLRDLRGPAVINFWASSCGPCREELPVMQKLADTGKLTVLGVDTRDTRAAAASFGSDHGVSMPTLFDPDAKLAAALKVFALPSTVFVDPAGKIYVHRYPLDAAGLEEQVKVHAGLEVEL
ncbi:TlpA family protein disulfide reductase [Actinoplanes sp. HUAS TT8]|uniref:TlpA family protein disulfide reductase n=1 Tax=Actinoplanes sp. HUAS TT8 TaxID=3447453 RepID=UPI003F51B253